MNVTQAVPALTQAQENELRRLKMYFPYRICWAAVSPAGEFQTGATVTKRQANDLARNGWAVFQLA